MISISDGKDFEQDCDLQFIMPFIIFNSQNKENRPSYFGLL
jgi:hypothetical protein